MPYQSLGMDRVMEVSSAPPGTGTVALGGAVPGFKMFSTAMAAGDTCAYFMEGVDANGSLTGLWERGFGTLGANGVTFARNVVSDGSSGNASTVNFTGNVRIGCSLMSDTAMMYHVPGGRLSASSVGAFVDGSGSIIYYHPYVHDWIHLWNGSGFQAVNIPPTSPTPVQLNIAGYAANTGFDVWGSLSGSNLGLSSTPWTGTGTSTARSTALAFTNGIICSSADPTKRYLGSFYTHATGTCYDQANQAADGLGGRRMIWNMYNRIQRANFLYDSTTSWTDATAAWHNIRNLTTPAGCIEFFRGRTEEPVVAGCSAGALVPNGTSMYCGIGLNGSTPGPSYGCFSNGTGANAIGAVNVHYVWTPGQGYFYLALGIYISGGGTATMGNGGGGGTPGLYATLYC